MGCCSSLYLVLGKVVMGVSFICRHSDVFKPRNFEISRIHVQARLCTANKVLY